MQKESPSLEKILNSMPDKYWVDERTWLDDIYFAMVSLSCMLLIPIVLMDKIGLHITVPFIFVLALSTYLYKCWSLYKKEQELIIIWINKQDLPTSQKAKLCGELDNAAIRLLFATGRFLVCLAACGLILALIAVLTGDDKKDNKLW